MKIRTLVVDSSNLLKHSFYGAKDVQTTKFGHIGGLYTFFTIIRKLINEHKINKVVLVWDGEGGGIYRHRIDKAYKANRVHKKWNDRIQMNAAQIKREKEKDASILKQRLRIQEYAEELFLRQIEVDDIEADDLIAEYVMRHYENEDVFIYSNDRDFAQLFEFGVTIIFPNISVPVTKVNYMMHFKHHYKNSMILKVICGDTSDNIAGIPNMGEKTLLKHFPELQFRKMTVREICEKADLINKERKKPLKVFQNLLENIDRLKINHKLINLKEPMLDDNARDALDELEMPLSPEDRGSENLHKLMMDDQFLSVYGSTFVNYVQPFYTVIMHEKQLLTEYISKSKKNI